MAIDERRASMGGGIWCGAQVYAACRIREALGVSDG